MRPKNCVNGPIEPIAIGIGKATTLEALWSAREVRVSSGTLRSVSGETDWSTRGRAASLRSTVATVREDPLGEDQSVFIAWKTEDIITKPEGTWISRTRPSGIIHRGPGSGNRPPTQVVRPQPLASTRDHRTPCAKVRVRSTRAGRCPLHATPGQTRLTQKQLRFSSLPRPPSGWRAWWRHRRTGTRRIPRHKGHSAGRV